MSKRRMLIAYSATSTHVQTTLDYLLMLQQHLGFDAEFIHVTHNAVMDFDINDYDVVFNNYCSRHCFEGYVSEDFRNALKRFRGLKVLAVQDEYDRTNTLKAAILDLGFHVVLTCVPQASLEYVYPQAEFGHFHFMTVFTGYVPQSLIERARVVKPLAERPIVVGYRGRDIGGKYGRLGFDKFEIGRRMKEECDARGVACDIAMDEDSRIYGTAWFDFIENCRSMLGSESGSNVFDFDGSLEKTYKDLAQQNNGRVPSYAEFEPFIAERDKEISMGQISPRVFECAALRTPMVLYRGRYSDAIEPDTHYIALEKDFSNVEDVLKRLENLPDLEAMTTRAFDDLIGSGRYTYAAFCSTLAEVIDRRLAHLQTAAPLSNIAPAAPRPASNELSPNDRILLERPTHSPLTIKDFQNKLLRLEALIYGPEIERLDSVYVKASAEYEQVVDEEIKRQPDKYLVAETQSALLAFRASLASLRQARQEFCEEKAKLETQLVDAESDGRTTEMLDLEAKQGALYRDWVKDYNVRYAEHVRLLNEFLDKAKLNHLMVPSSAGFLSKYRVPKIVSRGWRLLPAAFRFRLVNAVASVVRKS